MLVKPEDLKTELYPEVVAAISRMDEDIVKSNIKAAEDFAKGYLFKYDLNALFGTETDEPTHIDYNLKKVVKVITSYWLLRLANPNVDLKLFRDDWMIMIGTEEEPGWLQMIRNGKVNPEWPYKPDDPLTPEDESGMNQDVSWSSNVKRIQSF